MRSQESSNSAALTTIYFRWHSLLSAERGKEEEKSLLIFLFYSSFFRAVSVSSHGEIPPLSYLNLQAPRKQKFNTNFF